MSITRISRGDGVKVSHVLHVPDELYERLVTAAAQRGQTADELLLAYIEEVARQAPDNTTAIQRVATEDPLAPFIGAFVFGVGDLAEHHDHYLAQAYADEHDHDE